MSVEEEKHTWYQEKEACLEYKRKWKYGGGQERQESHSAKNAYEYVQKKGCVVARRGPLALSSTIWITQLDIRYC